MNADTGGRRDTTRFAAAVVWHVKLGSEERCEALLLEMQERTWHEPGCLHYQVHRMNDPNRFFVYECYVNRAAHDAHRETEHYLRLVRGEAPALLEEREIEHLVPI